MQLDENTIRYFEIFVPGYLEEANKIRQEETRFVYYTNADTAMKIIQNGELWLRNVTVMNDFKEISYGLELIFNTFRGDAGKRFKEAVESIFPGTIEEVDHRLAEWIEDWKLETYIACVSVHNRSEDRTGRLSMWRAYGNIALVVRNTPMMATTQKLAIYSIRVLYQSPEDYAERVDTITQNIVKNSDYLRGLGQQTLAAYVHHMLFLTAISSKHPGFKEEQEWRIFYRPSEERSSIVKERVEVLGGVPQVVHTMPLRHDPDNGLHHADIPNLIDRVIIGPTSYPYISCLAFSKALQDAGDPNGREKVVVSDIPLRSG